MHVFNRGRPKAARYVALLGVLAAFPVIGVGVAQASIGGATPATTTNRPDLRSVTALSGLNAGRVEFCFDKALSNSFNAANFALGGYRWDTILTGAGTPVLAANANCVDVPFGNGSQDLASYTFGTVKLGAVTANVSGGAANLADSTANVSSTSHNGTTGHTTAPDLQGVTVGAPAGQNEIIYTFDQPVSATIAGNFGYVDSSGMQHFGQAVTGIDGAGDVRVSFTGNGNPATVSGAQDAFVTRDAVNSNGAAGSATPDPVSINPIESVVVPGASGITAAPTLSAATEVGNNQIAYVFNQTVATSNAAGLAAQFRAVASNGDEISATNVTVESDGKTVLATFGGNFNNYNEEIVVASVAAGAVVNPNVNATNPPSGVPVGDNANAFATGFTNGPDATRASFNGTSGQVLVQFDQRVDPARVAATQFRLLDSGGNDVTPAGAGASVQTTAFQSQVTVSFNNPALVRSVATNGGSLEIIGNQTSGGGDPYTAFAGFPAPAVFTYGDPHGRGMSGFNAAGNVQQILAGTVTGASLQGRGTRIVLKRVHIVAKRHTSRRHTSRRHTSRRHTSRKR